MLEKDKRLYMTFPIDIHRHPKLSRLPAEVRWVFVEMNGEARIADNDGIFDAVEAEFMWGADALDLLVKSHPTKPLLVRQGDKYVIREYAKHQLTRADRERRNAERSERARKAANARWGNGDASGEHATSMQDAYGVDAEPSQQSQSQSQSHDLLLTESVSLGSNARAKSTDSIEKPETVDACLRLAEGRGLNLDRIIELAEKSCGRSLGYADALRLAQHITDKAKSPPKRPQAYVSSAFSQSPFEIQQWIDREVR